MKFEVTIPPELLAELRQLVREECAHAIDAQSAPPRLLTDERLCSEVLGISTQTLRTRLLPAGIPYLLVGDQRRWDIDAVLQWLASGRGVVDEER